MPTGRKGELRQPYREGQEEQLGALGLVVNCLVVNTIYTQRILGQLTSEGHHIADEDIRRLSPLVIEHVNPVGRYHLVLSVAR